MTNYDIRAALMLYSWCIPNVVRPEHRARLEREGWVRDGCVTPRGARGFWLCRRRHEAMRPRVLEFVEDCP